MGFTIHVTRNFEHMSQVAAAFAEDVIRTKQQSLDRDFVLGLATGNSPVGMYKHLAKAFNLGNIDAKRVISFNLDEYVGLPGDNPLERSMHAESYSFFMTTQLFGLMHPRMKESHVPWGHLINQRHLVEAIEAGKHFELKGTASGKAVIIDDEADGLLGWIRDEVLADYSNLIRERGGIDLHIIGVGGRGHVAFHESGIPFETPDVLLVQLDDSTVTNAVADGHFESVDDCPLYAVSMSANRVFHARQVLMVANGSRKTAPIAEAVLGEVTADVPLSYSQKYVADGGDLTYVLDEAAAAELLERADEVKARGYEIVDHRGEPYQPLSDITFAWTAEAGTVV